METKESSNLLLLGLELLKNLNKSTKLPYAVVKPRLQHSAEETSQALVKEPQLKMSGNNDRKRKHNGDTSEAEKREKRWD